MPKPLTLNESFPTTEGICPDALSLRIISPAYTSSAGELTAILQYLYHAFFFESKGYTEISDTLKSIAIAEMEHFELLGKTILALGAAPVYSQYPPSQFNFYSTKYIAYSCSLKNMLEDDILGERQAIAGYKKMHNCLKNEQVKAIIARILQDELLHLETLEKLLCDFIR